MNRADLNGVEVSVFSSDTELLDYVAENDNNILIAINALKIVHADDWFRNLVKRNLGYIDGAGPMLALKRKGYSDICKVSGCELWLKVVTRFSSNRRFYIVGGRHEVIEASVSKLRKEFPGINIVGYHDGYMMSVQEHDKVKNEIILKKPDVVFVAMGSPKQEIFMEEMQRQHGAIYMGLGGSLDLYTDRVTRAPQWWIDHNLEFAYRLIRQPKRIKRQIHLLRFAWMLFSNKL